MFAYFAAAGVPCRLHATRLWGAVPRRTLDPDIFRRSFALALVALALVALHARTAQAIAPGRPLTQSLQRIWQTQQGLPSAPIRCIAQTRDGYLWLGTEKGLFRFDGMRFAPLATATAEGVRLDEVWVSDLQEDREGNLWIATDGAGLIRLRDGQCERVDRGPGVTLTANVVRHLASDPQGRIWAAMDPGLVRIDPKDGPNRVFHTWGLVDLQAVGGGPGGEIWAGGEGNQLEIFSEGKFERRRLESLPPAATVHVVLGTADGTVWIGTSDGLVRWAQGAERRFTTADGLANDDVLCLASGTDGVLWVGTHDGFSRLVGDELESFGMRDGLSQSTVYSLCQDREGSLWVGTKHGLNQFLDRRTSLYSTREGLPSNDTGPVMQDALGNIWVGTLGAGLARFDGRHFSVLTARDGLAGDTIFALARGSDGQIWIGTDGGLNRLADGRVEATFTTAEGLPANEVHCLAVDGQGTLWAGTAAGLASLRDGQFVRPDGDAEIVRLPIRALIERQPGERQPGDPMVPGELLAAADGGGLYRCAEGRLTAFPAAQLPRAVIDAFFVDESGRLWMGTQGRGLLLLDGDRVSSFTTKDGLYDDDIFGIVLDHRQRLWMACSKGVFFVVRDALLDFAAGRAGSLTSTPFSPMDAPRTIECKSGVQPGVWKMADGRIWFSTIRGLIVIDPANLQRILPPTPVVIEDVVVNGKNERPDQLARLAPDQTNLEFRYTALSFATPTRTTFRYKLAGFDKDWVEAGTRREAFYTNLPPGNYRFELAARLMDGDWQQVSAPLAFTIEPHFYQTRLVSAALRGGGFPGRLGRLSAPRAAHQGAFAARAVRAEPDRPRTARHADAGFLRRHHGNAGPFGPAGALAGTPHAGRNHSRRRLLPARSPALGGRVAQLARRRNGPVRCDCPGRQASDRNAGRAAQAGAGPQSP